MAEARRPQPRYVFPPGLLVKDLPHAVLQKIAVYLDQPSALTNARMELGHLLGYDSANTAALLERGRCADFNYSPALALLWDYAQHRGTVVRLQRAFERMNHVAFDVILNYLISARRRLECGSQNTDVSVCGCPECMPSNPSYTGPSTGPPPPYHPPQLVPPGSQLPDNERATPFLMSPNDPQPRVAWHLPHGPNGPQQQQPPAPNGLPQSFTQRQLPRPNNQQPNFIPPTWEPGGSQTRIEDWVRDQQPRRDQRSPPDEVEHQVRQERIGPMGQSTPHLPNGEVNLPRNQRIDQAEQDGRRRCNCDKCRVSSDPEETNLMTTFTSAPREECCLPQNSENSSRRMNHEHGAQNSNDHIPVDTGSQPALTSCSLVSSTSTRGAGNHATGSAGNQATGSAGNQATGSAGNQATGSAGNQTPGSSCSCQECRPHFSRRSWPSRQDQEAAPSRMSQSSSDSEMHRSRIALAPAPTRDIEQIYTRTSFPRDSNEAVAPVNVGGETESSSEAGTSDLIDRMQELNVRNESGWGAPDSGNTEPRQTRRHDSGSNRGQSDQAEQLEREQERGSANRNIVFLTFSWNPHLDDQSHLREVVELSRQLKLRLREYGLRVKIDMDPETFDQLQLNKNAWLDQMATESKYVIVCISPAYYRDTYHGEEYTDNDNAQPQPQPDMVQLNARYIFNLLRAEYHGNGARNRRFIPVMFTNSGAIHEHIPYCMRSTLVYNYPDNLERIIQVILGNHDGDFHLPYNR